MKKIIELALKSGEITLQGVINLVDCIDKTFQERAVMLLTGNETIPKELNISDKGISLDLEGNIAYGYTCVSYNYLYDEVIANKYFIDNKKDCIETVAISLHIWQDYHKNYIELQLKEREEYVKKQQEQNAAE